METCRSQAAATSTAPEPGLAAQPVPLARLQSAAQVPHGAIRARYWSAVVLNGGSVDAAGGMQIGELGTLTGDGTVVADVMNGGMVAPGASPGTLHITGDYVQTPKGELSIELATTAHYDHLAISNVASLDGTLIVSLLDGFTPATGDVFHIFAASIGIVGKFAAEQLPSLPSGQSFRIVYKEDSIELQVVPEPAVGVLLVSGMLAGLLRRFRARTSYRRWQLFPPSLKRSGHPRQSRRQTVSCPMWCTVCASITWVSAWRTVGSSSQSDSCGNDASS
jgi:hypothetical protein